MEWNLIDQAKAARALLYKKRLYEHIGIPAPDDIDSWPNTYSEQITSKVLIE
jgi:hypothetical protein